MVDGYIVYIARRAEGRIDSERYSVYHKRLPNGEVSVRTDVSFEYMIGYVQGTCFQGCGNNEHIVNGFPDRFRHHFNVSTYEPLDEGQLKRILDTPELVERHKLLFE